MTPDDLPHGNRFGLPFTREEYRRALMQVRPAEEVEPLVRVIYAPDEETIGIALSDLDLLLLAALSDDVAERVLEYAPQLREQVQAVRADPRAFIRSIRPLRTD